MQSRAIDFNPQAAPAFLLPLPGMLFADRADRFAELADGTWHLCHVQRNHIYDGETNKLPYGAFRPLRFLAAVRIPAPLKKPSRAAAAGSGCTPA